jgi:hypothetical protein
MLIHILINIIIIILFNYIYNDYNTSRNNNILLKRELFKWNNFSYILRNKIKNYSKKCYNRHTNIQMQ